MSGFCSRIHAKVLALVLAGAVRLKHLPLWQIYFSDGTEASRKSTDEVEIRDDSSEALNGPYPKAFFLLIPMKNISSFGTVPLFRKLPNSVHTRKTLE